MSTTTTRRAVLAGAAALPALAVPAIAENPLIDYRAALARMEQVIDVLRTCYVCEGWHRRGLDEEQATGALTYFRRRAAGEPHSDDDETAVIEFIRDHGQSFDWIFWGDPGGMVAHGAARSPRALANGAEPDPIFSAIEAHRRQTTA